MPLTFPSHAAVPLPLKLWRPRRFDGVALVVGAAAPDLAYALDGSGLPVFPLSHQPAGLILFCLPVTLLCAALVRAAAPTVAAHLPAWPGTPPPVPTRPTVFWPVAATVALAGALGSTRLPGAFLAHTTGVRLIGSVALGLLADAAAIRTSVRKGPFRYRKR